MGDIMKTENVNPWLAICACMCSILLTSCSPFPRTLTFAKDNLVSRGTQGSFSLASRYESIEFGRPDLPYGGNPVISLSLPDGTVIRTDHFDIDLLRKKSDRIIIDPRMRIEQQGWPKGIEEIRVGGFLFLVAAEKVVWFGVYSRINHEQIMPAPEIGDAQGLDYHRMPFTEATLIRLFGKPETLHKDLGDLL